MKVSNEDFCNIAIECGLDPVKINEILKKRFPDMIHRPSRVENRLANLRRKGLLPLDSGNFVSVGEVLKGSSTLYDDEGNIKQQWVKTDVPKQQFLDAFNEAISDLASSIPPLPTIDSPSVCLSDLTTLYISNDLHFGMMASADDSEQDWNTDSIAALLKESYDYLFESSPDSKYGIVVDLGDLVEAPNDRKMTPKSGNILDVSDKYAYFLRASYTALIYAINKALEKHEIVYFYNITGNHDDITATAVREVIRIAFADNPRVIVDETSHRIKYHHFGQVLLQFFHGDSMKLNQAGETMAHDMQHIFSSTKYRFAHSGHLHIDKVHDGKLCKVESHRNLPGNNEWAYAHGYRRSLGSMKSITYHADKGEILRNTFNVS